MNQNFRLKGIVGDQAVSINMNRLVDINPAKNAHGTLNITLGLAVWNLVGAELLSLFKPWRRPSLLYSALFANNLSSLTIVYDGALNRERRLH